MRGQSFRLKSPTLGVVTEKETSIVPANAVITVVSEPDSTKFVCGLHDGRKIRMFLRDIEERGTPLVSDLSAPSRD